MAGVRFLPSKLLSELCQVNSLVGRGDELNGKPVDIVSSFVI